jgi:hypothetical protein
MQKKSKIGSPYCTKYMHGVFSVISDASSVKIWHPPRTGMEKGSEEGRVRGNEWEGRKPV